MQKILSYTLVILTGIVPLASIASVGVGVNLGKIQIEEPLKPGGVYSFPVIGVINTGDTSGTYEFEVTYHEDQEELRPNAEWFSFSPTTFQLEGGESQSVEIRLVLPVKMKPGNYFAYLEAHPVIESGPGTTIGIAAATKAYFTVEPANFFQAILHRVSTFFGLYAPWPHVAAGILLGAILVGLFRKFFSFNIGISRKE